MRPRLYVVPASHPCAAAMKALSSKGIDFAVTELPPGLHAAHQRLRFGARTVPSMTVDGTKISGSREIMRWAERRVPEPPLWPADPAERARIEEAEAWGEDVLQPFARRVIWFGLRNRPDAMPTFLEGSKLPVPAWAARLSGPATALVEWRLNAVSEAAVRSDVAELPAHLDRIAGWIDDGVIGGERPNAADLQIVTSLALIRTLEDLRPQIDEHPAGELVRRWFPQYPGSVPSGALP